MSLALGVLAHVDAGKTTLSEQLLFQSGAIRGMGRVDHGNTVMDFTEVEKARGITVYAGQATMDCSGLSVTLMDTPGHADFASEMEHCLSALDMVLLLIDGSGTLPAYTSTLFALTEASNLPVILVLNKTDLVSYDRGSILDALHSRLTPALVPVLSGEADPESLSMLSDDFCEKYLEGTASREDADQCLSSLFVSRKAFPLIEISALNGKGIKDLLALISKLGKPLDQANASRSGDFLGRVYRVRRETSGERIVYVKVLRGSLKPRQTLSFGDISEKVNRILVYTGSRSTSLDEAFPGDCVGVTGLSVPQCGDLISESGLLEHTSYRMLPVLSAAMISTDGIEPARLLEKARILEDEDPALSVEWDSTHAEVRLRIMGAVQTEILSTVMAERFGLSVRFDPPKVLYTETVTAPVVGCAHYEPLRHYAESHLRLLPGPRGSGISFESLCHPDDLPVHFQNLIRTHVFETVHKGVLTGSPLTDVRIQLLSGRDHLKHTEGGDFRETVYRAIRQALMKGNSRLLEPWYRFTIEAPTDCLGRVMSDLSSLFAQCDPPELLGSIIRLSGRVPVACMLEYPVTLRSVTHGQGDIRLENDGYDFCHNEADVIEQISYRAEADTDHPAGSVFCSHGAGYNVAWYKADEFMHLPVEPNDP